MIQPRASSEAAINQSIDAAGTALPDEEFPPALIDWLTQLRLMQAVPFSYVVPHAEMAPLESIRFFYLDRNWLDALVDGALSLGAATSRERLHLQSVYATLREALDESERKVWAAAAGEPVQQGAAEVITGFLLRSRAVSGWPAMHIRAYRDGEPPPQLRVLRMERLAPALLLVLLDGVPDILHLEEPRTGAQFGVDPAGEGRSVKVRDPATGEEVPGREVQVPFRSGSPGVIDMTQLRTALLAAGGDVLGDSLDSAELGLQLLQYPYRHVFAKTEAGPETVFTATISLARVRASHEL